MDLTLFDDVLVLLEEGNMTRTARRRNVTQPALSRRIRAFEAWLGRDIVLRGKNRIEIDPALRDNRAELRALVTHIRELRARIASYDPARSTVTIAAQHSLIVSAFPGFAASAIARFPAVGFRVRAGNRQECTAQFVTGEATVLMRYDREGEAEMPFADSVDRVAWGRDRLVPVVGGALRFRLSAEGEPPPDLPVIVYPQGSFFGDALSGTASHWPARTPHRVVESAFAVGIREMAMAGLGLAWLPMSMIGREVRSGALLVCSGVGETVPLQITVFAHSGNEAARTLCHALK